MSRLEEAGNLERLAHGVYRDAGAPSDEFEDLRAAWLGTEPKLLAEERLGDLTDGIVVASASAAMLHGVGDLWAHRHELVSAKRRQTQRTEIRYRQRHLEDRDATLVKGLPVMTLERTPADLLDDVGELGLVADALGSAVKKRSLDFGRLRELFSPLAERNGFKRQDGNAVLDRLLTTPGLDFDSVARRISGDSALSLRILANYLQHAMQSIETPDLSAVVPKIRLPITVPWDVAQGLLGAIRPELAMDKRFSKAMVDAATPNLSKIVAEIVNTPALANISKQWTRGLSTLAASTASHGLVRASQESEE